MNQADKTMDPDQYDKLVLAEIPNSRRYTQLHKMVVAHIMHGPRGPLNPKCPCMSPNTNPV
jgi:hypothetical protein